MAQNFLSSINLTKNELQNARIQNLATPPASPVSGQIYFDTSDTTFKYWNGSAWISVKDGDITKVIAGAGLTGGGESGEVTLTANTDGITLEVVDDKIKVKPEGIGTTELKNTGVTAGTYGSATAIPNVTVDIDGRITNVSTSTISSILKVSDGAVEDDVTIGTDTLNFSGTTNEVTTAVTDNTVTIGLPDSVTITQDLTVNGNLLVSGTQTTVNTETILLADNIITLNSNATGAATENAGIEIERGDDPNMSLFWDETAHDWYATDITGAPKKIINEATLAANSYAVTITDTATITHNLNTKDVIIQLYDTVTSETVFSDVVRASVNTATITFASTPANSIRVLVTKIG